MQNSFFPTAKRLFQLLDFRMGLTSNTWRVSSWWRRDKSQDVEDSLLRVLNIAHKERLDASELVRSLASEHRGVYRRRLQRLAQRLVRGVPVVEALEQTAGLLRDESVLQYRFATQSGLLNSTLPKLVEQSEKRSSGVGHRVRGAFLYFIAVGSFLLFGLAFIVSFIQPTYLQIAEEMEFQFNQPLSAMTFIRRAGALWLLLIPVVLLLLRGVVLRFGFPGVLRRRYASRCFASVAKLRVAQLLSMLSDASRLGRPLAGTLSTLARYHFDPMIRQKLLRARNEIEQGMGTWESLAAVRLITEDEAGALSSLEDSRQRTWVMEQLADQRASESERTAATLVTFLHPILILLLGCLMLWIAIAVFGSLYQLITFLA